jgi:hypothetical protein
MSIELYFTRVKKIFSHLVPAGSREVTVAFNFIYNDYFVLVLFVSYFMAGQRITKTRIDEYKFTTGVGGIQCFTKNKLQSI